MQKRDEEIIIDYLNGEKAAFTEIVDRYLKPIYNFNYRLIGNKKDAEDVSQIVFTKAWKNIRKFDTEKGFKTWIFSIAKNSCIDYLRKRKDIPLSVFDSEDGSNLIEDNLIDEELKADETFSRKQDKEQLDIALSTLSIVQRQIIILKYVNEMSLRETAEILNMPTDTVKSHHRRALIMLEKYLSAPKSE
jgi:RNA polymerase sigma-70 factor (ECF subfamily)